MTDEILGGLVFARILKHIKNKSIVIGHRDIVVEKAAYNKSFRLIFRLSFYLALKLEFICIFVFLFMSYQGRIYGNPVADVWAGALMRKR